MHLRYPPIPRQPLELTYPQCFLLPPIITHMSRSPLPTLKLIHIPTPYCLQPMQPQCFLRLTLTPTRRHFQTMQPQCLPYFQPFALLLLHHAVSTPQLLVVFKPCSRSVFSSFQPFALLLQRVVSSPQLLVILRPCSRSAFSH